MTTDPRKISRDKNEFYKTFFRRVAAGDEEQSGVIVWLSAIYVSFLTLASSFAVLRYFSELCDAVERPRLMSGILIFCIIAGIVSISVIANVVLWRLRVDAARGYQLYILWQVGLTGTEFNESKFAELDDLIVKMMRAK